MAPTTVSVVGSGKAEARIAPLPSSQNGDLDGCMFCKSRRCSGHETLLTSHRIDPVVFVTPRCPEEPRQEGLPPQSPGPAAPLVPFSASFNPRGPPFFG